jgi:hypothetical protein
VPLGGAVRAVLAAVDVAPATTPGQSGSSAFLVDARAKLPAWCGMGSNAGVWVGDAVPAARRGAEGRQPAHRQLGGDADAAALGGAAVRTGRVPMSASVTALIETRLRAGAPRRSARPWRSERLNAGAHTLAPRPFRLCTDTQGHWACLPGRDARRRSYRALPTPRVRVLAAKHRAWEVISLLGVCDARVPDPIRVSSRSPARAPRGPLPLCRMGAAPIRRNGAVAVRRKQQRGRVVCPARRP